MSKLERYVGRSVRLNKQAFSDITRSKRSHNELTENCFVVASVNQGTRKLICYGANQRIAVGASQVVLI